MLQVKSTLVKKSQDKSTEIVHLAHCPSWEEGETPLGLLSNPRGVL